MAVRNVRWIDFEVKNANKTEAFEKMCTHIFCRTYHLCASDIVQDYNQPGLEIFPVKVNDEFIGFQCKYCEDSKGFYSQVYDSINTSLSIYPELTKIIVYTQLKLSGSLRKNSVRKKIEKLGEKNNCKIEFFCNVQFELELSKNSDIYDFYFSNEKIERLFRDSISIKERDFLLSHKYFDLKLTFMKETKVMSLFQEDLKKPGIYLFEGRAGTGKTEILKKIFIIYEQMYFNTISNKTKDECNEICIKPIFIRFREINTNDLLSRVNSIKMQYKITDDSCKFAYFFDGVDEINTNDFFGCVSTIKNISQSQDTYSIFFTSRLDSSNYFVLLKEFNDILKYTMGALDENDKKSYINMYSSPEDKEKILDVTRRNSQMFNDIFSLNILCSNSKDISNDITIVELIDFDIKTLEKLYYNKINMLNLLNPKNICIRKIMSQISYEMSFKSTLKISIKKMQELIANIYPGIDYISVNTIIEILLMMFFDVREDYVTIETYAMFKHKRYYEYFLYIYLKDVIYNDPFILRDLDIFSKREFFISFLLTQEIKEAHKNVDLYKIYYVGFIISRLTKDYCSFYFNKWINEKTINDFNEITYYDKSYVDYLCLLNEDEIKTIIYNKELLFNSFINSHNNSKLLFTYYLLHEVDLSYLYKDIIVDFEDYNEEYAYYILYEYITLKIDFDEISKYIIKCLDSIPLLSEKKYISNIRNGANYNSRIIIKYLIEHEMDNFLNFIITDEVTAERFDKLCYIMLDDNISWIFSSINDNDDNIFKKAIKSKISAFSNDEIYYGIFAVDYLINKHKKESSNIENYISEFNVNHLMTWKDNETVLSILSNSLSKDIRYYHSEYHYVACVKEILFFYKKSEEEKCIKDLLSVLNEYIFECSNFFTYDISIFISNVMCKLNFESANIKNFIENVSRNRINKFAFIYNVFCVNKYLFVQTFDCNFISLLYEESKNYLIEYDTLSQKHIMFSNMLSLYDKDLFYKNILKSFDYNIFRPNYSKENIVSVREPMALYLLSQKKLLDENEKSHYLKRNLLQLDVIRDTCYKSYFPDMLKYLYNSFAPIYEYNFKYDTPERVPLELNLNSALKKFSKEFIDAEEYKDYNIHSFDFWCECVQYLKENNNMGWIYEFLEKNYYPSFYATNISQIAFLIIGALIKCDMKDSRFLEFITSHISSEGYFQLMFAFFYSNDYDIAKKMFESIYNLVDVMIYYDRKHCESFDYPIKLNKKIMNIVYNSQRSDYIFTDFDELLLYQKNPDIYIKIPTYSSEGEYEWEDFNEKWAEFYGHKAKMGRYYIYYKNHIIDYVPVLSVDGARAYIPLMDPVTGEYDEKEYKFVQLLCDKDRIDQYIWQAKFNINRDKTDL